MCFYILSWISRNDAYASGIGMYAIGFFFFFLLKLPFFIVIDLVILSDSLLLLLFYSREYA